MAKNNLFRTSIFGGYNKQDVDEYVERLEQQLRVAEVAGESPKKEPVKQIVNEEQDVMILDDLGEIKRDASGIDDGKNDALQPRDFQRDFEEKSALDDIKRRLKEKEKLLEEKTGQCKAMEEELAGLRKFKSDYEADYKAVKNVLLNARVDAEVIVAKAHEKANLIMANTQKKLVDKKKNTASLLLKCLDDNSNSLSLSKGCLETQIRSIDMTQKQIESIIESIKNEMASNDNIEDDDNKKE